MVIQILGITVVGSYKQRTTCHPRTFRVENKDRENGPIPCPQRVPFPRYKHLANVYPLFFSLGSSLRKTTDLSEGRRLAIFGYIYYTENSN